MNIFKDAEQDIVKGVKYVVGLESKAQSFVDVALTVSDAITPELKSELVSFIADTESFVALASTSVSDKGLNIASDTATWEQFLKVKSDVLILAAAFEKVLKATGN